MSFDRLQEKIDKMNNPTVVVLDPAPEHIPPHIMDKHLKEKGETLDAAADAVLEFNIGLIDALYDIVPAVKPQSAYYEMLGPAGVLVLKKTIDYAKAKNMYVICDGKRNDIGSTAAAYSAAYLGTVKIGNTELFPFDADALTVNAYLGSDGIKPFLETAEKHDKAVFALVRTSKPSAGELQNLHVALEDGYIHNEYEPADRKHSAYHLYTAVGDLMEDISRETIGKYGFTRVGAVVGATYPKEAEFLRARLANTFFLVPGYGAQGGSAEQAARSFDKDGRGAIVNSSRAIIAAWKTVIHDSEYSASWGKNYQSAAREETIRMRNELRMALTATATPNS